MTPAATLVNPYPGLAPFEEQDAARFFGRDREIDQVLERLAARRLLAVIGVSGCGKSSLVHAGVIPVLRMGVAENLPARFRICSITPGNAPLKALAAKAIVVLSHGLTKERDVPKGEIDKAVDRKKRVEADFKRFTLRPEF